MFDQGLTEAAESLLALCRACGLKIATAESCTGGLVAGLLTSIAGSSDVVERGWVTYSNEAKSSEIGVPPALITQYGAVSEQVAKAMAEGVLISAPVELAISVTGIAGPGGATATKPVGLVYIGTAQKGKQTQVRAYNFAGDRTAVRSASVAAAIQQLRELLAG
jgi:nicotinamide-nucleotide amidase